MFDEINLPRKLLLAARQKIKIGNAFSTNMQGDIKLFKAQISKIA